MDAIQMLKDDHHRVKKLFDTLRQVEGFDDKFKVFLQVKEELTAHSLIEETVFYPAFSSIEGMKGLLESSFSDHQEFKDLLEDIEDSDTVEFGSLCDELIESVDMHLNKEEEEFFPKAQEVLGPERMVELADRVWEAKAQGKGRKKAA